MYYYYYILQITLVKVGYRLVRDIVHMWYFEVRAILHTLNLTSSSVDFIVCSPLCQKAINFISIVRYFRLKILKVF